MIKRKRERKMRPGWFDGFLEMHYRWWRQVWWLSVMVLLFTGLVDTFTINGNTSIGNDGCTVLLIYESRKSNPEWSSFSDFNQAFRTNWECINNWSSYKMSSETGINGTNRKWNSFREQSPVNMSSEHNSVFSFRMNGGTGNQSTVVNNYGDEWWSVYGSKSTLTGSSDLIIVHCIENDHFEIVCSNHFCP